jgi:hypothetical protein
MPDASFPSRAHPLADPEPLIRPMEPAEPFPIDALPPIMQAGVLGVVGHTLVDPGLAVGSVLTAWSLVAQAHANARTIGGSYVPLSLYILSVAASGERKTSADNLASRAIDDHEVGLRKAYAAEAEAQRAKLGAWEKEHRKILGDKKVDRGATEARLRELGPPPRMPLTPVLTCPEPTFEGLTRLLAEGPGVAGVLSSEGGQFIGGHGMREDVKRQTAAALSSAWDGSPIKRVRAGDGITVLAGRRVCMHLMVQPGMSSHFLTDEVLVDQGLLARFLVAFPRSRMGTRFFREPTQDEEKSLEMHRCALAGALALSLPRRTGGSSTGDPGELWPRGLELTAGARDALVQYSDYCEALLAPGQPFSSPAISGFGNKLTEHATRLAGVFAFAENPYCDAITEANAEAGILVAGWFTDERLRIIEAGAVDPSVRAAETLRQWLFSEWEDPNISASDVAQYGPNSIRCTDEGRAALQLLAGKSWLEPLPSGGDVRGRRRREAWRIRREAVP